MGSALAFLTILGIAIYLSQQIRPAKSVAVVLAGADYASNLSVPHNALGWRGLGAIEAIARKEPPWRPFPRPRLNLRKAPVLLEDAQDWHELVDDLAKQPPGEDTILIVLALHGMTDSRGAYLIPDRASEAKDRLPLSEVIKSLGKLPPAKQKILVLEGAQVAADWGGGMLANDFARRLGELDGEIRDVENLWVLGGCDVDQLCWDSEGLGRTAFSHFLADALRGRPDEVGPDGRLSLTELHKSVKKRVANWAWEARGEIQEPVLLPGPASAEGRRGGKPSASADEVLLATVPDAPEVATAAPFNRARPTTEWLRFRRLDALVPHPSVYSPGRWREFRASLVRFEELSRAGSTDRAAGLIERLDKLERLILRARALDEISGSAETNLVANVLRGGAAGTTSSDQDFTPFRKPPGRTEGPKAWEAWKKARPAADEVDGVPRLPARSVADGFLLRQAAEVPAQKLNWVSEWLEITRGSDFPQPAEAHYARMLRRFLAAEGDRRQDPGFWQAAARALALRVEAERSALGVAGVPAGYHYAEEVHPRIRSRVGEADESRRMGEDQLFSWEPAAWTRSSESLGRAAGMYRQAADVAATARAALAARDRLFANLPDYSRWLAHRLPGELDDETVGTVEALWGAAHTLADLPVLPVEDDLSRLAAPIELFAKGFEPLVRRFQEQASRVAEGRAAADFEAVTAAAAVPFPDTGDLAFRATLWDRLDSIRMGDVEIVVRSKGKTPTAAEREEATLRQRRRAAIQARMALAAMGRSWFEDPAAAPDPEQGGFALMSELVRRPTPDGKGQPAPGTNDLAQLGEKLGSRWHKVAEEIKKLIGNPDQVRDDLGEFQRRLVRADRLARSCIMPPSLPEKEVEASGWYRRTRVHDLLLWLAGRTWLDHWDNDDPPGNPQRIYHLTAGALLIDDAEKLFPNSDVARARDRLARPGRYELLKPDPAPVLTSELGLDVDFGVARVGDVPTGLPVVRPHAGGPVGLRDDVGGWRPVPSIKEGETVRFTLEGFDEAAPEAARPAGGTSDLTADLYFRGRRTKASTKVEAHPLPEVVSIGFRPSEMANLSVRADPEVIRRFGQGNGSLAIVLDCSGSMNYSTPNAAANPNIRPSRFDDARAALQDVLGHIPAGSKVGLWIFGQQFAKDDPRYKDEAARGEIKRDPSRTIKRIRDLSPWKPEQKVDLDRKLKALEAFTYTPLIEAMTAAKLELAKSTGLKTLLVLTDGNDSEFARSDLGLTREELENDEFDKRKTRIHAQLRNEFDKQGIVVNIVFFKLREDELRIEANKKFRFDFAKAKANFEIIREFNPPGQFFPAENIEGLKQALSRSIRQKLTWDVVAKGADRQAPHEPIEVVRDQDQWWPGGLPPGPYELVIQADREFRRDVLLAQGDRLIVKLTEEAGGIGFVRGLYSDDFPKAEAPRDESAQARLTILNGVCKDERGTGFQMVASLESLVDRVASLEQVKPRFAWFDLAAQDARGKPEFPLRWREVSDHPAPAWQFDSPRWVQDPGGLGLSRPALRAWWNFDSGPAHAARLDLSQPGAINHREVLLAGGKTVVVESLDLEEHRVEHRPGEAPLPERCLVVRIDYRQGEDPVLVDPEGVRKAIGRVGYEHRIYAQARKYAGLFWPVNDDQFAKLKGLDLISLARVREEAGKQRRTITLDGDEIPRPAVGGRLPPPAPPAR